MLVSEKITGWKNKLLDLGKRNRLLSYKVAKVTSLQIIKPDFHELFKDIAIHGSIVEFYDDDLQTKQLNLLDFEDSDGDKEKKIDSSKIIIKKGQILATKQGKELSKSLYQLHAKARTSIEEQGINILYLAFGFLEWKEVEYSRDKILSPLVLVPVELSVESIVAPYKMKATEDDVVLNPVLIQKLEMDFGITLPELPEDDDLDIAKYLDDINSLVIKNGWSVNNEVHLSLFSFLKLSMYKDLDNNMGKISKHTIIKALSGDDSELRQLPDDFINGFDIDKKVKPLDSFQVLDADSSQQEAIIASKEGISYVLQGPPGTGKSQTIANIIVQSLADGKKVLFVSEKMAALEVVYNRLKNAGLDDFCLELHSYKSNKKDVISELGRTLRQPKTKTNEDAVNKLDTLLIDRDRLNDYNQSLHTICKPLNKSIYQVIGTALRYEFAPNLSFEIKNPGEVTQDDIRQYNRILEQFAHCSEKMGADYVSNPWYKCNAPAFTLELQHDIMIHFGTLKEELSRLTESLVEVKNQLKTPNIKNIRDVMWLIELLQQLTTCPQPPKEWLKTDDLQPLLDEVTEYHNILTYYRNAKSEVELSYNPEVYKISIDILRNQIQDAELNVFKFFTKEHIYTANDLLTRKEEVEKFIESVDKITNNLLDYSEELSQRIGIRCPVCLSEIAELLKISDLVAHDPRPLREWFKPGNIDIIKRIIEDAKSSYDEIDSNKQQMFEVFDSEIINLDINSYLKRFRTEYSSTLRYIKPSYYKNKKEIIAYVKSSSKKMKYENLIKSLEIAKNLMDKQEYVKVNISKWKQYLGDWFNYEYTKWDDLMSSQNISEEIIKTFLPEEVPDKLLTVLLNSEKDMSEHKSKNILLQQVFNEGNTLYNDIFNKILVNIDDQVADKDIYKTDLNLLLKWLGGVRDWLLPLYDMYDTVSSKFRNGVDRKLRDIEEDLVKIKSIISVEQSIGIKDNSLKEHYGHFYSGLDTEWEKILSALNWTGKLIKHFSDRNMSDEFVELISSSCNIRSASDISKIKLSEIICKLEKEIQYVKNIFDGDLHNFYEEEIECIYTWVVDCNDNLSLLEEWIDFRTSKEKCIENGLDNFVEVVLEEKIQPKYIVGAFFKRFYRLWLDFMYNKFPSIRDFRTRIHEGYIQEFRELDKLQLNIAQSRLKERLSSKRPDPYGVAIGGSEISILNREVEKRRKNMPIRKLFQRIPNLLLTLKPCLLMSPLSVSLYLDSNYFNFDLVIFDEASQVCSEDAIGAIYRGQQLIVVGDREQLPPTNFFNSSNIGDDNFHEDNEEDTDSYESILDECGGVLNKFSLLWHYRSLHEDLITFSNAKIYKNLITFSSPNQKESDFGVQFIYVKDAVYDRSITRTNKIEAKRVAEIVTEHIKMHPERSLGVIAFSQSQQQAIDAEIRRIRIDNPKLEPFFNGNKKEAFFVKNLENVQGDERDTIVFSIGYAKDQNGIMYMNFGPLSKQGGYRRLNVAITRAKFNIKLVSSIKPTDIDLEKTNSDGVKMLRSYLEYAIHGPNAILSEISVSQNSGFDSPFEEEVYKALTNKGYQIDIQVGCSGYRIDMAVKHPELSGCYILGIECDGATYHSARTARERDRLREEVLRLRGWNIYRIWSTDWIKDEKNEIKRVINAIENAINNYDRNKIKSDINNILPIDEVDEISNASTISFDEQVLEKNINKETLKEYRMADISNIQRKNGQDDFKYVADIVRYVVKIEGPIHFELLAKRLTPIFNQEKVGNQLRKYLEYVLQKLCNGDIIRRDNYCWYQDMKVPLVRIPLTGDKPRPINYICPEEISEVMKTVIRKSIGINKDNLFSETAKILGYNRIGVQIKECLNKALDNMIENRIINIVEDIISITLTQQSS